MAIEYKQPTEQEFKDIMDNYWFMIKELEQSAQENKDIILKHCVNGFFLQWSEFAGVECKPVWGRNNV